MTMKCQVRSRSHGLTNPYFYGKQRKCLNWSIHEENGSVYSKLIKILSGETQLRHDRPDRTEPYPETHSFRSTRNDHTEVKSCRVLVRDRFYTAPDLTEDLRARPSTCQFSPKKTQCSQHLSTLKHHTSIHQYAGTQNSYQHHQQL